jgi:hypothetical protein
MGLRVGESGIIGAMDGALVGDREGGVSGLPVVGAVEGTKGHKAVGGSPNSVCI